MTTINKYRRILSAVHMVYRLVNSTYNVKELSLRLTRLLCQFIKADSSNIYILDPAKNKLGMIASFNNKINVLIDKKKDLAAVPQKELDITKGISLTEKHVIGLPLVADENIGAIIIKRKKSDPAFNNFDREMLSVFAEQAVTAIKNLQFYENQQEIMLGSIKFIKNLIEKHGHLTSTHTAAYAKIIKALAERLGMGQEGIENLQYASLLHDAGLVDVPIEILTKSSQLSPDELKVVRMHPAKCVELIKPVDFLKPILPIILYHHEKYDGTGYPIGLKKEQIPLGARVMAVVDAFEAMIRGRPYKKGLSISDALQELKRNSGTQFDPVVVKAFLAVSKQKKFRKYLSLIKD